MLFFKQYNKSINEIRKCKDITVDILLNSFFIDTSNACNHLSQYCCLSNNCISFYKQKITHKYSCSFQIVSMFGNHFSLIDIKLEMQAKNIKERFLLSLFYWYLFKVHIFRVYWHFYCIIFST